MRRRTLPEAIGRVVVHPGRHDDRRFVVLTVERGLLPNGAVMSPGQARQIAAALIECAEQQERWR
ncbi:MAG TPA: hypothetical protein VFG69_15245 [Nannocystaceae bacterium]|nr:hypothetical protein [Nannocystaceae bacterium]